MILSMVPFVLSMAGCTSGVTVSTKEGPLQGFTAKVLDKEIQVFLGIPYAKPPVGNLRFNKPQASEPWLGLYDATRARDSCVQPPFPEVFNIPTALSEDCLYLNVWTPLASTVQKFPVLVWFHGGMFQVGSAYEARYNGSALAALNDVVVVSCNFRLSVLGFLDLNHATTPGNVALWDQQTALQWVQRNIMAFGGDPGSVTVFGESSGSMMVHGHILSPHSRGLFHRVFLMSGTMSSDSSVYSASESIAGLNTISEAVGCGPYERASDPGELLHCLRERTAHDLCAVKMAIMRPTYENEFIPCRPSFAMKEGYFENYDAMVSVTANEGAFVFNIHPDKGVLDDDLSSYELERLKDSLKVLLRIFIRKRPGTTAMNYVDNAYVENNDELRNVVARVLGNWLFYCPARLFAEKKPALPDGMELPKFTPEHPDFMWLEGGNYTVAEHFASAACDMWKEYL
ncbi:hypothetical protein HPB50_002781 [Hyalomma asiaticum]|uniref:Uncharacterized protein n=1 Tax=Hyalomma asiaticum TaxID=266040 RepID=A0ACB7S478_HYAAI|nr:hypothetical protein HPB50_002781 [Hyalomma asiaticum]